MRAAQLTALLILVVVGGAFLQHALNGPAPYTLTVPVQDAAGLYAGSDVMIAGSKVGTVDSIVLGDGVALVTAGIEPAESPVHQDATITVRPKSLLGERYLALNPGRASTVLSSGAILPRTQVSISTDLQDVINSFDAPTRDKLQTVVVELGGGVADRGPQVNQSISSGREDLSDLSAIAQTVANRHRELQGVIQDLDVVTQELARSDRSQQLGQLIVNTQRLMKNLADEDGQLLEALTQANGALTRTASSLDGTEGNLGDIALQLPATVRQGDLVLSDLSSDSAALLPHLGQLLQGIQAGPQVFGGRDAAGYATRISLIVGTSSAGLPPSVLGLPSTSVPVVPQQGAGSSSQSPTPATAITAPAASAGASGAPAPVAAPTGASCPGLGGVLGFLLGGPS
jgi:phospholipid/cholesterol/gamma-HCH transport system substrate-binding protein